MKLVLVLVLGITCCSVLSDSAGAQTSSFNAPRLLEVPKLPVPDTAREFIGTVRVNVAVDARGRVTAVLGVVGPGDICPGATRLNVVDLRTAAKDTALKATFAPATLDGLTQASEAWIDFELPARESSENPKDPFQLDKVTLVGGETNFSAATASESREQGDGKQLVGGVLNGKALNLPRPVYPAAARAVRASGAVQVQVLIEESGSIFSARAVSGHPLLRAGSVAVACEATFSPTRLSGQPVKVSGVITYNYVP